MESSEALKKFINDPDSPRVLGQPKQGPKPPLPPIATIHSEPGPSSKDESVISNQASSDRSTSPSTSPSPSILSRRESESSNTSTAPSDAADSLVGNLEIMSIGGQNRRLPCLLREIIRCPVTFRLSEREHWYSHSLSHYGDADPPRHALCIFCHTVFDSSSPAICWSKRMNHIADHFENNRTIERSRPDFRVIEDMWKKGCISEEDYKHCFQYTERPPCDSLRPHDYIPEEIRKKQEAAFDQANRLPVPESRQEVRDRARGKRPAFGRSKKSTIVK
jgi:hypothetical protein